MFAAVIASRTPKLLADVKLSDVVTDDSLTDCPECQGRLRKIFNAVGVVFKGSGFYRNDSRDKKPSALSSESKSDGKSDTTSDSGGSSSAKSETKSEKKTATSSSSSAKAPATA